MAFSGFTPIGDPPRTSPPERTWTVGSGGDYTTLESAIAAAKNAWARKITLSLIDSSYTCDPSSELLEDIDKILVIKSANIEDWEGQGFLENHPIPVSSWSNRGEGIYTFSTDLGYSIFTGSTSSPDFSGTTDAPIFFSNQGSGGGQLITSVSLVGDSPDTHQIQTTDNNGNNIGQRFYYFPANCTINCEANKLDIANSKVRFENVTITFSGLESVYFSVENSNVEFKNFMLWNSSGENTPQPIFENSCITVEGGVCLGNSIDAKDCKFIAGENAVLYLVLYWEPPYRTAFFSNCVFSNSLSIYLTNSIASMYAEDCVFNNTAINCGRSSVPGTSVITVELVRCRGHLSGRIRESANALTAKHNSAIEALIDMDACNNGYKAESGSVIIVPSAIDTTGTTTAYTPATSGTPASDNGMIIHP